ncbi:1,4-beta-N-acetylmuramidase [Secundilactobacillus pentosiphilus]|uniref:1,4-beta-N-acetylmuramidase n=1 Tax=Secundilactobacillus pentosiphilus TaxID=1714682 RepID=A0A1Z5IVL2_9LACO|nr:GH25 family lysozyme [Secundilactobacillus pentosiphilus]GAX05481.1 1,4-beta-N-acetylmuramidase [Secundilactobacillus pentosiphilus]
MPRYDIVDISNNNGYISTTTFRAMRCKGVKAIISKVSEDTYYYDPTAKGNLSRAKSMGLKIHGYHFARFTTVSGAKSEAYYAVKCARAARVPKGAVLVCDFESYNRGWTENGATTRAFAKIIKAAGYRYDLYTMGGWTNSVSINNSGRAGWIANYPYHPSGMKLYSSYNAWQWTSGAHFTGSSSRFDVSVAYSDFYTKGATSAKPKNKHEYFDWNPAWIYPRFTVAAYRTKAEVGHGKGIVKYYKPYTKLHVKQLIKSKSTKYAVFQLTNGLFVTANRAWINNLYYTTSKGAVKRVKSVHGTNKYKSKKFDKKHLVASFRAGTLFDVAKVVKVGSVTRLQLSDGTYISGNKLINNFVK